MDKKRKIIHIDMDAFFASVEQRDNPSLRGLPIVVGSAGKRGVVATASYEARKFGIRSAMSSLKARQLCPDVVFVSPRMSVYKAVSEQMHEIFHEYTDKIEPISVDEAFLDVTQNKANQSLAVVIAREIKDKIKTRLNLTASAGVSYNKFLAKIASDLRKPDGLATIHPSVAQKFIDTLKIEQFWGIGAVTAQKFHKLGVYTGADLRGCTLDMLLTNFGKAGALFYKFARGEDNRLVEQRTSRKSVGCEETYIKDLVTFDEIAQELEPLTDDLVKRIERHSFEGLTLTLKIKYSDFTVRSKSVTRTCESWQSREEILKGALDLLEKCDNAQPLRPVRLLGLTVSNPLIGKDSPKVFYDPRQLRFNFDTEL